MAVLVDTNVIVDVLHGDPVWVDWANAQLTRYAGELWINPMIYAELCYSATSSAEVDQVMVDMSLNYEELTRPALFLAAKAYQVYRQRGGTKTTPLPDFFIGAHAEAMGIPILTRDPGRYKTYFPGVPLICP
ncbi:MAG: type II toxin-antitoxin system VapC family toxin [Verrucomicrobiota bacterium]